MPGTKQGGKTAADTNRKRHGLNFYQIIGAAGGRAKTDKPKGFAANRERARIAGAAGGRISRRGKRISE